MKPISKNQLQRFKKLNRKKYRDQFGQYYVSGLNAACGSLTVINSRVEYILVQDNRSALITELELPVTRKYQPPILLLTERQFRQFSNEVNPQGIALILKKPRHDIKKFKPAGDTALFLEKINDPGNLGTIIRTALFFGTKDILLSPGSADPYQPKAARAAAGALAHINIYENITGSDLLDISNRFDYRLSAAVVDDGIPLEAINSDGIQRRIILLGSEAHGLSDEFINICDEQISVGRSGPAESLNLAVAAGLFLYHFQITRGGESNDNDPKQRL